MDKPIVCDLDGVIVDCLRPALQFHGRFDLAARKNYPLTYEWEVDTGLSHADFWGKIDRDGGIDWWANLPFTAFGKQLLRHLFGISNAVSIATKVVGANGCAGKYIWATRNLPKKTPLHLTTEKSELSMPGRVLIDDSPDNIEKWTAKGGSAILCPASYNDNRYLVGEELNYIKASLRDLGYGEGRKVHD